MVGQYLYDALLSPCILISFTRASGGETACMMHHMSAVPWPSGRCQRPLPSPLNSASPWSTGVPTRGSGPSTLGTLINLTLAPHLKPMWWGRTMFRVDNVDILYQTDSLLLHPRMVHGESGLFTSQISMGMSSALRNASPQQQLKSLCAAQRIRAASDNTKRSIADTRRRIAFGNWYTKDSLCTSAGGRRV